MFMILPHGSKRPKDFLYLLNSIHNIQTDGQLPFLGMNIYRKPDSSLGHKAEKSCPECEVAPPFS
jgi:hypothetical protein